MGLEHAVQPRMLLEFAWIIMIYPHQNSLYWGVKSHADASSMHGQLYHSISSRSKVDHNNITYHSIQEVAC